MGCRFEARCMGDADADAEWEEMMERRRERMPRKGDIWESMAAVQRGLASLRSIRERFVRAGGRMVRFDGPIRGDILSGDLRSFLSDGSCNKDDLDAGWSHPLKRIVKHFRRCGLPIRISGIRLGRWSCFVGTK